MGMCVVCGYVRNVGNVCYVGGLRVGMSVV
jgi:hypothetical protein